MFDKIKKRDGRLVKFDANKITQALVKAGQASGEFGEDVAAKIATRVLAVAGNTLEGKIPQVEEIQDVVEEVLLNSPYKKTAKEYIVYREQHARIREINEKGSVDLVDQYLEQMDWQVKENSNMAFSLQGLNNYISSEISKVYWLNKVYSTDIKNAYINGDIHLHDLDKISVYCVGWDLADLLAVGFKGVAGKIESSPAKHLRSALGQVVNFFYTLQGEAAGAQAFSSFDTLLAPFIRYDKLNYKEVKQVLQEFIFNMNVPTRVGFQTPFTNITMDLNVPSTYKNEPVVIGGEIQQETYSDFQEEMNIFNKAFFEVMMAGDARGRVFTFPIPTYNITKDFDWDNPNLEYLWEMTGKYGIPYFSNFVNSDMSPDDVRSMCCRLRIDNRELKKRGGGLFGANPLTGSIGVVTINLPRIGYLAENEEQFLERLGRLMDISKKSLEIKRKVLENFTEKNLYPYAKFYLRKIKERFDVYWKNHFNTIGILGMNEALINLLGENIATEKGHAFATRVMDFMRTRLAEYQEETGNIFNLEATPAEGTSYRMASRDKDRYPDIICANEEQVRQNGADPFYTNSTHLPVNFTEDIFEALDLQDDLQAKYTGGTVVHLFMGEKIKDTTVIKKLVKKICEDYKLPYFSFSPTFSVCPVHGYLDGEHFTCPECQETCEVYSRIVGYLRPVAQWNKGKLAEYNVRKKYDPTCVTC